MLYAHIRPTPLFLLARPARPIGVSLASDHRGLPVSLFVLFVWNHHPTLTGPGAKRVLALPTELFKLVISGQCRRVLSKISQYSVLRDLTDSHTARTRVRRGRLPRDVMSDVPRATGKRHCDNTGRRRDGWARGAFPYQLMAHIA